VYQQCDTTGRSQPNATGTYSSKNPGKKIKNFEKMAQNFKIKTQSNKIHNKISHFQQNPLKNHRKNKKLPINANFRNKQPKSKKNEEITPKKPIFDEK